MNHRRSVALSLITVAMVLAVAVPAAQASPSTAAWQRALTARSADLNRTYHLGRFSVPASPATLTTPTWLHALETRGDALNQRYSLGRYAVPTGRDVGFSWKDAGIGAAFSAALCLALLSLSFATRGRLRLTRPL
jgi:hypothetical protein